MGCIASIFCCAAECACCLACRSLFACCGGGKKDGETEATKDAGRCGSMWMMILAMLLSLGVQYYLAKYADFYAWTVGCGDDDGCKGAAGVYRVSFCTATFFLVMALATRASPAFHDGFWGAKFLGWIVLLVISAFVPNYVFDADGYLWVARFGGFLFVILQQVLLIDLAYYVNESLVALGDNDSGDVILWCGVPSPLVALLGLAVLAFSLALAGIVLLFYYFGADCSSPDVILGLTVCLVVLCTATQLFVSKDSNLLTSSVVAAYLVYLAASAVTANPVEACNPFYNNASDWLSICVGLGFTVLALAYTVYSASSSVQYLASGREANGDNGPGGAIMNKILTGQLEGANDNGKYGSDGEPEARAPEAVEAASPPPPSGEGEKTPAEVASFNLMALMAMQVAMVLTNWGSITKSGSPSAPSAGSVAMWMQAAAQWTAGLLFLWTNIAPALFPDRDFA